MSGIYSPPTRLSGLACVCMPAACQREISSYRQSYGSCKPGSSNSSPRRKAGQTAQRSKVPKALCGKSPAQYYADYRASMGWGCTGCQVGIDQEPEIELVL